jgi:hypothetical protein
MKRTIDTYITNLYHLFRSPHRHILWHSIQHHDQEAHLDFLGAPTHSHGHLIRAFFFFSHLSAFGIPPMLDHLAGSQDSWFRVDCFYGQSPVDKGELI